MREIADRARTEAFLAALAREAATATQVFVVGGTSAVLVGWRESTIDIDLVIRPESDAMLRAIPELYRFPAIDSPSIRRAVDAVFPEPPTASSVGSTR